MWYLMFGTFFIIGLLLSSCPAADFVVRSILLQPTKLDPKWKPPFKNCEEVYFPMKKATSSVASSSSTGNSGKRLHGLYFPYVATPQAPSRGVILFSHGNGGTVEHWGELGAFLRDRLHVSIFIYDYRGYGKSDGKPTAGNILTDARSARKWLAEREKIDETEIIQMGRSLGGAVAIDLAAKDGAKALIVESTFASLPDMVKRFAPAVPAKAMLLQQLSSVKKIRNYNGPFFQSHGTEDSLIPLEQGQRIFDAAGSKNKTFYKVPGGDHNTPQPETYYRQLVVFLDEIQ